MNFIYFKKRKNGKFPAGKRHRPDRLSTTRATSQLPPQATPNHFPFDDRSGFVRNRRTTGGKFGNRDPVPAHFPFHGEQPSVKGFRKNHIL